MNNEEKQRLIGYACALQDLMFKMTGENTCAKSYDPLDFTDGIMHSYAFDFKSGGRHHDLSDFEDINEIKEYMLRETMEWIEADYKKIQL